MKIPAQFDEMRPYTPQELPQVYEELIADPAFKQAIAAALPQLPYEHFCAAMRGCKSNDAFQLTFCKPFLEKLIQDHSSGIGYNFDAIDTAATQGHTFVSNHRDIVLDSALLSLVQFMRNEESVEIAIGDNLLIHPWIKKLVRVNKSFIVQRSLPMREMLASSKRLSQYIHFVIGEKKSPVWIAQREGRAKDSNDLTQESLIKMLAMGGEGCFAENLMQLNIAPLSISYEYDPCDYLKAQEFQQKRDIEGFKKSKHDDLVNMQTGIFGYKGAVYYHAAPCINAALAQGDIAALPRTQQPAAVAALIDRGIHANYRLFAINYVAADLLQGGTRFAAHYTAQERESVCDYFAAQYAKIELPQKDEKFLMEKLYQMYANPLLNHLKAVAQ